MRIVFAFAVCFALNLSFSTAGFGQDTTQRVAAAPGAPVATKQAPPFTYLLFWKQNDANTQQFAETIRTAAAKRPERANWTSIDVNDQANQAVVAQYGVSRAPMPLALCVAQNGAITAVFTRRPNDAALDRALVTPAMVDVTKALQDKKIVVVHVKPKSDAPLPYGAFEFTKDPAFQARATVVDVVANDPAESRFLTDMEFNAASVRDSAVVVMAPPGVLVGKFASTATKDEIAAKLHAAGKCCNDPNCKHNNKAQAQ
ncbi:MAG: hypothetical protein L0228_17175 [Planctomycetes bacterium]|nr:hypothetical protein [Planctomycetota bacterium]